MFCRLSFPLYFFSGFVFANGRRRGTDRNCWRANVLAAPTYFPFVLGAPVAPQGGGKKETAEDAQKDNREEPIQQKKRQTRCWRATNVPMRPPRQRPSTCVWAQENTDSDKNLWQEIQQRRPTQE